MLVNFQYADINTGIRRIAINPQHVIAIKTVYNLDDSTLIILLDNVQITVNGTFNEVYSKLSYRNATLGNS